MATSPLTLILETGHLPPAQPVPMPALVATTRTQLVAGGCLLLGWSLLAGATAAVVTFLDGTHADAPLLAVTALAAAGSANESVAGGGVLCSVGLWVVATKATAASVVWAIPL